jgi:hypothetical protein
MTRRPEAGGREVFFGFGVFPELQQVTSGTRDQGAGFRPLTERLDTTGPMGTALLTIMAKEGSEGRSAVPVGKALSRSRQQLLKIASPGAA